MKLSIYTMLLLRELGALVGVDVSAALENVTDEDVRVVLRTAIKAIEKMEGKP